VVFELCEQTNRQINRQTCIFSWQYFAPSQGLGEGESGWSNWTVCVFCCRRFFAEFEFDNDNRVLSRDDIKRMSAELLLANQRRALAPAPTNQKTSRRRGRRKKTAVDWWRHCVTWRWRHQSTCNDVITFVCCSTFTSFHYSLLMLAFSVVYFVHLSDSCLGLLCFWWPISVLTVSYTPYPENGNNVVFFITLPYADHLFSKILSLVNLAVNWQSHVVSLFKHVATLPCEMLVYKNSQLSGANCRARLNHSKQLF